MNNKEAHDFHCKEFTDFYEDNQTREFGEDRSKWQDKEDYASSLYSTLQDARECEGNPFQLVSYSAGVWSGEVYEEGDSDVVAVAPDLSNLPLVPKNLDLWLFMERLGNPDAHADGSCECLERFADALKDSREDDTLPPDEEVKPALFAFMKIAAPEYTAVLRCWNQHLSDSDFWRFWEESHWATFQSYWNPNY